MYTYSYINIYNTCTCIHLSCIYSYILCSIISILVHHESFLHLFLILNSDIDKMSFSLFSYSICINIFCYHQACYHQHQHLAFVSYSDFHTMCGPGLSISELGSLFILLRLRALRAQEEAFIILLGLWFSVISIYIQLAFLTSFQCCFNRTIITR